MDKNQTNEIRIVLDHYFVPIKRFKCAVHSHSNKWTLVACQLHNNLYSSANTCRIESHPFSRSLELSRKELSHALCPDECKQAQNCTPEPVFVPCCVGGNQSVGQNATPTQSSVNGWVGWKPTLCCQSIDRQLCSETFTALQKEKRAGIILIMQLTHCKNYHKHVLLPNNVYFNLKMILTRLQLFLH